MKLTTAYGCLAAFSATLLASSCSPLAHGAAWSSRFDGVVGSIPVSESGSARISTGPSGEFFVHRYLDPGSSLSGLARLDPMTAATQWSALDPLDYDGPNTTSRHIVIADGSSIFLSRNLTRFSPDGQVIWSIPADSAADVSLSVAGELLFATVTGRGTHVRRLSINTGATLGTLGIPQFATCSRLRLDTAAPDASVLTCGSVGVARISASPLDVVWYVAGNAQEIAVDAAAVYELSGPVLRKRALADGDITWEVPVSTSFPSLQLDSTGNLIVVGSTIERRDAISGAILWTSSESGRPRLDTARENLYFADTIGEPGTPTRGRVGRIDLATGATLWTQETPLNVSTTFNDVAATASRIMVIGTTCAASVDSRCSHAAWASATSGGGLISSPLLSRTSTSGGAALVDAEQTLAIASGWGEHGPQMHLRALANSSGAPLMNAVTPLTVALAPYAEWGWTSSHLLRVSREVNGHFLATFTTNSLPFDGSGVNATLAKIDRTNGNIAWQRFFLDKVRMAVVSQPVVDSAGNVAVGVIERFWSTSDPDRRWVRKYSGVDGSLLWEREFPVDPVFALDTSPPSIARLGDDVGVYDTPLGSFERRFTRLSGIDGATQWSLGSNAHVVQSIGPNGIITRAPGLPLRISRIDESTGLQTWTMTYEGYPDSMHTIHGVLHGDDGDLYVGGSIRTFDLVLNRERTMGSLLRIDGDDGDIVWDNRLELNPVWPTSRVNPRAMDDGNIYATQPLGETLGTAITAFSTANGIALGSSFLFSSSIEQPHLSQQSDQGVVDVYDQFGTIVSGEHFDAGDGATFVVSNLGDPIPGPTGALRIGLEATPSSAGNAITYSLVLEAHNDGVAPVDNVNVLLALPPGSILGASTCDLAGTPCTATFTATSIEGTFTIPAGATVRFLGTVTLLGGSDALRPDRFSAYAFAPHPFTETNLQDNQASVSHADRIFGDAFEN